MEFVGESELTTSQRGGRITSRFDHLCVSTDRCSDVKLQLNVRAQHRKQISTGDTGFNSDTPPV